jgi:hypothetical protein
MAEQANTTPNVGKNPKKRYAVPFKIVLTVCASTCVVLSNPTLNLASTIVYTQVQTNNIIAK